MKILAEIRRFLVNWCTLSKGDFRQMYGVERSDNVVVDFDHWIDKIYVGWRKIT